MNSITAWLRRNLFYVIYYALTIPLLIFCLRLDDDRWRNWNWIVGRCVCLVLIFIVPIAYRIWKKEITILGGIFFGSAMLLNVGLLVRRDYVKYKNNICREKFGLEFNEQRQRIGIPIIPKTWHSKGVYGDDMVDWSGDTAAIGHAGKTSVFTSGSKLNFERDDYNLEKINGKSISISILTQFPKGKGIDTISYSYYTADSTRTITRHQADSIFAAEKIRKDY
jgi:hypothetical protein